MKVLILLGLVLLAVSIQSDGEPATLDKPHISLLELLNKIKEISEQIAEEGTPELPENPNPDHPQDPQSISNDI